MCATSVTAEQWEIKYRTWSIAMKAYLQIQKLWDTIQASGEATISTDQKKLKKSKGKLILAVDPINYHLIEEAESPKDAWQNLENAFDDDGLTRKVSLIQKVSRTKLENCESMESYTNKIISAAQQLKGIGMVFPDEWIGSFLLAGLPTKYKPLIMALEGSCLKVTTDLVETKLVQESRSKKMRAVSSRNCRIAVSVSEHLRDGAPSQPVTSHNHVNLDLIIVPH